MPFTNTALNSMLDSLETDYSVYGALFNGDPSGAGTEVTGGSPAYARVAVTLPAASGGIITVTADSVFDVPAAATVNYVALYDAPTAGNLLAYVSVTEETFGAQGTYTLDTITLTVS